MRVAWPFMGGRFEQKINSCPLNWLAAWALPRLATWQANCAHSLKLEWMVSLPITQIWVETS